MGKKTNTEKTNETAEQQVNQLREEIRKLKIQLGGFQSSNANYKKRIKDADDKIKELEDKLADARKYGAEADELYNKRLEAIDTADKTIETLRAELDEANKVADANKKALKDYITAPWWKRMFMVPEKS